MEAKMEVSVKEPVKQITASDTLEKDFDHGVEEKVSVKEPVNQITANNTLEKDLDHDVEEKVSVEEQKQATTINTLEKDVAHGTEDVKGELVHSAVEAESGGDSFRGGDSFGANCWFD